MVLGTIAHTVTLCSLGSWSGDRQRCRWCDAALASDAEWCSVACAEAYENQHDWAHARTTRLTRDGECCVECGTGPATAQIGRLVLRALIPMGPVDAARLWHSEAWLAYELSCSVDVVHRVPTPAGYHSGCHNHLDGIITLCRHCQDRNRSSIDLRHAS